MKLAILHYHLNRGGVTRVIENQLRSLDAVLPAGQSWPVALIYGGRRQGWPENLAGRLKTIRLSLHEEPLLDYDSVRQENQPAPTALGERLSALLDRLEFSPEETVVHVHNHALGKNGALPLAVRELGERGFAMLLQAHDFAEDLRPENFQALHGVMAEQTGACWHGWLWPQASHVHYALLNGRDREILRAAGADAGRVHLLPNPVRAMHHLPSKEEARRQLADKFGVGEDQRFVLYPVRGIRRKNLGETLLHAALAPPGTVIGLTLAPLNPAEKEFYSGWRTLSDELKLPVRFGLGAPGGVSFAESVAAADVILTTSLAEGFGMVFLESWLTLRPLVGRDLPEITSDFVRLGLRLDSLYARLRIPTEWVGLERFRRTILAGYRRALSAYGLDEPPDLSARVKARTQEELLDFGDLDEELQQEVIRIVCRSEEDRRRVLDCNPSIERRLATPEVGSDVINNFRVVQAHYSLRPSGRRLLDLYERVASPGRDDRLEPLEHASRILDRFLDLKRFRLIRS